MPRVASGEGYGETQESEACRDVQSMVRQAGRA